MNRKYFHIISISILSGIILAACATTPGADQTEQFSPSNAVEKTIYVGPVLVDCEGVAPQKCMLIRENPQDEYTLFYDQIEGFDYEEGFEYELVVREEMIENPPADASSIKWILVRVESKEPVPVSGTGEIENKNWVLSSYMSQEGELTEILPNTNISATFAEGQVNGIAGCNNYFGGYQLVGDNISFGPLASTEMFCMDPPGVMEQESAYLSALGESATYEVTDESLIIANASGDIILTYAVSEPLDLTDTNWQVIMYNNGKEAVVSVILGTELTAIFDDAGQLNGSAGCNNYTAAYELDGENISVGPAAVTRKFCNEPEGIMEQESAYLAALEKGHSYQIENDRLKLLDMNGLLMVEFQVVKSKTLTETVWHLDAFLTGLETVISTVAGSEITAIFGEDETITGSAGCNSYSGTYKVDGNEIEIELGPLTMMFCEDPEGVMDQESDYLEALQSVTQYKILGEQLVMMDDNGQEVLQYRASDLVGILWMWQEFLENNDTRTAPVNPADYTLEFQPDGIVNIKADCNVVGGTYTVDGSQINIETMMTTLAACPRDSLEDEYLRLLNDAVIYFREGDFLYLDIMMDVGTMRFSQ